MAPGYLYSGRIADRENNSRNIRIRRNYGSLDHKLLAETTAIPAEKRLNSKAAASDWPAESLVLVLILGCPKMNS
jgi:hypothetical protein